MSTQGTQVLLVECTDQRGLVHAITGVLVQHGVNVVGNQEFVERGAARFFMRTEFEFDGAVESGRIEPRSAMCCRRERRCGFPT